MKDIGEMNKEEDLEITTEELIPISRRKAFKTFISGLFRQTSNPEIIVSFNGKTFSLNRYLDTYADFLKSCPGEEDVLEQELLAETNTKCDPQEGDPNWDGGGSGQKEKFEVVEKDFQVIPSTKISFCEEKVSCDMPCNQIDPAKLTGIPDPRTLPVIVEGICEKEGNPYSKENKHSLSELLPVVDGDADYPQKTESSVEVNGKFFVKPRE